MNRGLFATQINAAEGILATLGLLKERNQFPRYVGCSASDFSGLTYAKVWEKCYSEKLYDFLLTDAALIQMRGDSFAPLRVSYVYYESPYENMTTFADFRDQAQFDAGDDVQDYELLREYEMLTYTRKEVVTPLRYDYSPDQYTEGRHPASHVHFGHESNIRVGTRSILRPISFLLFVIRQCYPNKWADYVISEDAEVLCRNVSQSLDRVQDSYWGRFDSWEMTLV